MMLKRLLMMTVAVLALSGAMTAGAHAVDYTFDGVEQPEYYGSTNYEEFYGSRYQYAGTNAVDYAIPELRYGTLSNTSIGAMEKVNVTSPTTGTTTGGSFSGNSGIYENNIGTLLPIYPQTAFTSASDLVRSDGSIGTLKIPSLGINMKVWEGETNASMAKGLGHYTSTSGWDGNVGVCGHNRGAKYVIGRIKDLDAGDRITYSTLKGTRTYEVVTVRTISNTDWSYLSATTDNRITLTTCLADQPTLRICVQAVEIR